MNPVRLIQMADDVRIIYQGDNNNDDDNDNSNKNNNDDDDGDN